MDEFDGKEVIDLAPQPLDVHVDQVRAGVKMVAPHAFAELGSGKDPAGVAYEQFEQRELARGEGNRLTAPFDRPLGGPDQEIAHAKETERLAARAADERPQARRQFIRGKRLRQVIVGAGVPAFFWKGLLAVGLFRADAEAFSNLRAPPSDWHRPGTSSAYVENVTSGYKQARLGELVLPVPSEWISTRAEGAAGFAGQGEGVRVRVLSLPARGADYALLAAAEREARTLAPSVSRSCCGASGPCRCRRAPPGSRNSGRAQAASPGMKATARPTFWPACCRAPARSPSSCYGRRAAPTAANGGRRCCKVCAGYDAIFPNDALRRPPCRPRRLVRGDALRPGVGDGLLAGISPAVWRAAFNDAPCDHRFFEVIERAMHRQFDQRYFVLENREETRIAVQPFFLVRQDLATGLPRRVRSLIDPWRKCWPHLLTARILMVGNPAGEGRFEDYVAERLGKTHRKSLRRKWRAISRQPPVTMALADVRAVIDDIFPLHLQVYARAKRTFEALTPEYLLGLQERMPDKVRCFVWRQRDKVVAFNLCLVHGETLYDLDVGFNYEVAFDLHLYFLTWRDVVDWCLRHGIRTYHGGPLNYDPKLHLRFELVPQDLYVRHAWRPLGPLLRLAARLLGPVPHEPLLKRFPNYPALFS